MQSGVLKNSKTLRTAGIAVLILLLLFVFNAITNKVFLTERNLTMLLRQSSVLMVLASSLMMLLITRNIDLGGGAGVYLTGTVMAILIVRHGWNTWAAISVGIVLGIIMGTVVGWFIGYFGLPAFIVTLGAQLIFRGTGYVLTNAATIGPLPKDFTAISDAYIPETISIVLMVILGLLYLGVQFRSFKKLGKWYGGRDKLIKNILITIVFIAAAAWVFGGYRGIPMAVLIAAVVAVIMHFISSKTVYGREIYLIGGNMEASRLAGVRTSRRIWQAYVVQGLMYGIAGALLCARLGSAAATGGQLLELDAVAAACIGGTSMSGGVGSIMGLSVGVVLYTMIDNVMSLMNVSSHLQMVAKGLILLMALSLDTLANKVKYRFKLVNRKTAEAELRAGA